MKLVVLSSGAAAAPILYRGLCDICPDDEVVLGYEHNDTWTWIGRNGLISAEQTRTSPWRKRYCVLLDQWLFVMRSLIRLEPDLVISEGIQGVLATAIVRLVKRMRIVYWSVDCFPGKWPRFLDRLAERLADSNWTASPRLLQRRGGLIMPFMYEPTMRPRREQYTLIYVGGIRHDASLYDAMVFARKHGLLFDVVGKVIDSEVEAALRRDPNTTVYSNASLQVLHERLTVAKYGWAHFAGGESNYSNNATSRKIREYLEWSIVPLVATEHVDSDLNHIETPEQAYKEAVRRERIGLDAWRHAINDERERMVA